MEIKLKKFAYTILIKILFTVPNNCFCRTPGSELIQKKKAKRKRKGKLPKNYDPHMPPDPERWLPRHERTGYRKKKDRRNKDIGKGTQGAATGASDQ